MNSNHPQYFSVHWLAKGFWCLAMLSLVMAMLVIKEDQVARIGAFVLSCFALWMIFSLFQLCVIVDGAHIFLRGYLFVQPRTLRWDQIKAIRKHINPYGWPIFLIIPREKGLKGFPIGPEIAGYKQLLKEILLRVPPDTEIDPQVLQLTKFLNSPEGCQHLSDIREQHGRDAK